MGTAIVVTSGKGGTGKTSITGGVAGSLARLGHSVLCIDMDIGLRNLDVVMGLENRIVYNLVDVVEGNRCGGGTLPSGPRGGEPPRSAGSGPAHRTHDPLLCPDGGGCPPHAGYRPIPV